MMGHARRLMAAALVATMLGACGGPDIGPLGTASGGGLTTAQPAVEGLLPAGALALGIGAHFDEPVTTFAVQRAELRGAQDASIEDLGVVDLTPSGQGGGFILPWELSDGTRDEETAARLAPGLVSPAGVVVDVSGITLPGWYVVVRLDGPAPSWDGIRMYYTADDREYVTDVDVEFSFDD